jgi:alpha-D-xyloside xylohydrolase
MLNRAVGGAYGFHCDTGGYFDLLSRTSRELFVRWSWHAALTPGNRLHGGPVRGQRFPWSFDDKTAVLHRESLELHRAAEPYILDLWREARETGIPITRPLWLQYPEMEGVHQIDQEYLLGPDVLVAPVVEPGVSRWEVRFPPGCWRHPETGAEYNGPAIVEVPAPLDSHLYYFTCGTEPFTPPD